MFYPASYLPVLCFALINQPLGPDVVSALMWCRPREAWSPERVHCATSPFSPNLPKVHMTHVVGNGEVPQSATELCGIGDDDDYNDSVVVYMLEMKECLSFWLAAILPRWARTVFPPLQQVFYSWNATFLVFDTFCGWGRIPSAVTLNDLGATLAVLSGDIYRCLTMIIVTFFVVVLVVVVVVVVVGVVLLLFQ